MLLPRLHPLPGLHALVLLSMVLLYGCNSQTGSAISTGIANAESFSFDYLVIDPESNGKYKLSIKFATLACQDYEFTQDELVDLFSTREKLIGSIDVPFFTDNLKACQATEKKFYDNNQLYTLRQGGHIDLSNSGGGSNPSQLDITVEALQMVVQTASAGPLVTGPMVQSTVDFPGHYVGITGSLTNAVFSPGTPNPPYWDFTMEHILSNPDRYVFKFAFIAKSSGNDRLVIVWDGDGVLQD